jgi:hypothetical protein
VNISNFVVCGLITLIGVTAGHAYQYEFTSARIKGVLKQNSIDFPFTLIRDDDGRIVATISGRGSDREMKVYWDNRSVYVEETETVVESSQKPRSISTDGFGSVFTKSPTVETEFGPRRTDRTTIRMVEGEEAVTMLFDLIATTVNFELVASERLDLEIDLLKDYSVELKWKRPLEGDLKNLKQPDKLRLISWDEESQSTLIREVTYLSFDGETKGVPQPTRMSYTDLLNGETGEIVITSISLNPGIPDFLFDPARKMESD